MLGATVTPGDSTLTTLRKAPHHSTVFYVLSKSRGCTPTIFARKQAIQWGHPRVPHIYKMARIIITAM